MIADWRATLERVERLLADADRHLGKRDAFEHGWVNEALTDVRGLLAEPQVNPSEAKDLRAALREAWLGEDSGRRHALHGPTHNCSPDVCMIGQCPTIRGILAEGEENPE